VVWTPSAALLKNQSTHCLRPDAWAAAQYKYPPAHAAATAQPRTVLAWRGNPGIARWWWCSGLVELAHEPGTATRSGSPGDTMGGDGIPLIGRDVCVTLGHRGRRKL
jgi:hypothetical protein